MAIYGGFAGTETTLAARNTIANTTTLSAERGSPTDSTDNHFNVLRMYDVDSTTILDGLTIQDGYALHAVFS